MRRSRLPAAAAAVLGLLLCGGCGAGLITGVIASDRSRTSPAPIQPPSLSLPEGRFPLVPPESAATAFRTVVVANAQLQGAASLSVEIRALGVRAAQESPVIVSGQGGSTVVGFLLRTEQIVAAAGEPTARDLPGQLAVLVAGNEVAPPVPITLLRQPTAQLRPGGATPVFVSPLGGTGVALAVTGLVATRPQDLQVQVTTADPTGATAGITRLASNVELTPDGAGHLVTADLPGNTFSGQATLVVVDSVAGRSTPVRDVYYRPEVTVALPGQGPTTGGRLVTLIGRALVPLDFSVQPARPAFEQVRLRFRKGEREVALEPRDLRPAESDLDRLVFTMPPSPDGRPGQVDVVLRALLGSVEAQVTATDVFTFSNPQPVFGPRGAVLDRRPVASTLLRLEGAPGGRDAPDFALLHAEAGVSFLQLLMAEENGMFIRFGAPRRLGDPEQPSQRDPVDLTSGDFDGDGVPDLFALNRGSSTAVHHLILGQSRPAPPLGAMLAIAGDAGMARCRAADFDGDGVQDLLLVPGPSAPAGAQPQILLARPGAGGPAFLRVGDLPVRPRGYEGLAIVDLDGDGLLDVAMAAGGLDPVLDIAYGNGDGSFLAGPRLDLIIAGYTPDSDSPLVGVHACGTGTPRPLALVMAGLQQGSPTPPVVAVVHPHASTPRSYEQPNAQDVLVLPTDPPGSSLAADLDGDGVVELVAAVRGDTAETPVAIGRWSNTTFTAIPEPVERGAERMLSIGALYFGTAFPADPAAGRANEVRAVFAVHDSLVDGVRERRLSTLLVGPGPALLAPDLGGQVEVPIESLVGGSFDPVSIRFQGTTRDLAIGTRGNQTLPAQLRLLRNDGAGGFFGQGAPRLVPGLVPETLTLVQVTPEYMGGDSLAYFTQDGRLGLWTPDSGLFRETGDLRLLSPNPNLVSAEVSPAARVRCVDVDGDGLLDLVVQLAFVLAQPGEGDALLLLMRGKPGVAAGEFPFHVPAGSGAVTRLHGNSTGLVVEDFAPTGVSATRHLEVAVAVPRGTTVSSPDGNHVRFYRWVAGATPDQDRLVRSAASAGPQVLLGGDAPTRLAAADFDSNGTIDLLVAAAGDSTLRLFLNSGAPGADPAEVNLAAFTEAFTSPRPLSPGEPRVLRLGDINGDGNVDALVTTLSLAGGRVSTVAFYLSDGTGSFGNPVFVSPTRLGDRDGMLAVDLSDFNGDGQLDLAVGWDTFGVGVRNVRVLFGGSR